MELTNINEIKALLSRHGFHFSKALGQNFLISASTVRNIAESSGADQDSAVLEIGPGIGVLTKELSALAGKVVAVELDKRLPDLLKESLAGCSNVEIVSGDILKLDLKALAAEKFSGLRPIVCANLPYNITTPVLTALIESGLFSCLTVMIQREVARRICAAPGAEDYGAFTVFCNFYTEPEILFDVSPGCFIPQPKVTSSVIRLRPRTAPPCPVQDERLFFRVVRASFAQRRKTLVNGLHAVFGDKFTKEELGTLLESLGFDARVRGETLSIPDFARISDTIFSRLH